MKKVNTKTREVVAPKLKARPDSSIDLSDIPEIKDWTGAARGLFTRPATRQISIRLAAAKGLPYQTYIK